MKQLVVRRAVLGMALGLGLGGGSGGMPQALAQTAAPKGPAVDARAVAVGYGELVHASYGDVLASALDMQKAIAVLIATPSQTAMDAARKAWLDAREFYGQTEAYRFYAGPIDNDEGPEGQLNAWPMDESYVDYVEGKPDAGFVNDPKFKITKENLVKQNERGGEENITTGWHAIEFLLWGQDLSDTGPGNRSFEDYMDGKRPHADRRRQYLQVVTELLLDDLNGLVKAWTPGPKSYRNKFDAGGMESVRKIIVGLGSLSRGELAGERMEVPLNSQDQEDEHSCFSDNTHRDMVTNALGIQNVWLGRYKRRDGSLLKVAGVADLVTARNAALATRTSEQIAKTVAATEAIQAPFDREIIGGADAPGRKRIQAAVDSATEQSKLLVQAANAIGITKLTLVQP
ncbi:iron-regulated protein [Diaphorobacter ruginosibacter]|uniref:Iron-regulated protein n=2 Tax=Diaphorobacter ruginosibacter TaxID=1715720 RepID=A0A7G9RII8_9BURK|nr:iron-regulated protein [Diaphorobacter ruginosibacter]